MLLLSHLLMFLQGVLNPLSWADHILIRWNLLRDEKVDQRINIVCVAILYDNGVQRCS